MKGSKSTSKGSNYLGKSKAPVYSNMGGNMPLMGGNKPSYTQGLALCISYQPKGSKGPVKYDPPTIQGYSKGNKGNNQKGPYLEIKISYFSNPFEHNNPAMQGYSKNNQKSPYLEIKISDFSNPFDQESLGQCDICKAPVQKPFRMCPGCSSSLLSSYKM